MHVLELSTVQAHEMAVLLDGNRSGSVDIDEFCQGCLKFMGDAKNFDIQCMILESQRMLHNWSEFMSFVEKEFKALKRSVHGSTISSSVGLRNTNPANVQTTKSDFKKAGDGAPEEASVTQNWLGRVTKISPLDDTHCHFA